MVFGNHSAVKPKKENFYRGILLGLFAPLGDGIVSSNAESGEGYSDILIEIPDDEIGIVIEVKYGIACYQKKCKVIVGE